MRRITRIAPLCAALRKAPRALTGKETRRARQPGRNGARRRRSGAENVARRKESAGAGGGGGLRTRSLAPPPLLSRRPHIGDLKLERLLLLGVLSHRALAVERARLRAPTSAQVHGAVKTARHMLYFQPFFKASSEM